MKQQFHKTGVSYEIFNAVDGRAVSSEWISYANPRWPEFSLRRVPNILETACALSHKSVIELFLASDQKECAIFEDDVILPLDMGSILSEISKIDSRIDIIKISGLSHEKDDGFAIAKVGASTAFLRFKGTMGAAAYVLRRNGAKKLLRAMRRIRVPYDILFYHCWMSGAVLAEVRPYPVGLADLTSYLRDENGPFCPPEPLYKRLMSRAEASARRRIYASRVRGLFAEELQGMSQRRMADICSQN